MEKPIAYNYVKAEEEIKRLKEKVANLEIRCRIAEGNKPEWIPVGERLPEKAGMYIVTRGQDGFEEDGKATWAIFDTAKKKFYYPGERVNYYIDVTAWMPLPEPYKEGNNE